MKNIFVLVYDSDFVSYANGKMNWNGCVCVFIFVNELREVREKGEGD